MIEIIVPATSANLGPGFDCLGLALELFATFHVDVASENRLEGCPPEWASDDNLFLRSFRHACALLGVPTQPLTVKFNSKIPPARGLGSSASLAVAGAAAALLLAPEPPFDLPLKKKIDETEEDLSLSLHAPHHTRFLLRAATDIEGHPDNAAPAIFGGFTAAAVSKDDIIVSHSELPPSWKYVACIPDFMLETSIARHALPETYARSDIVHALSHAALTALALQKADSELLRLACEDRVHEPYRRTLIADFDIVAETCRSYGSAAVWISGSGPTIMAAFDTKGLPSEAMAHTAASISAAIAKNATRTWHIMPLDGDNAGIRAKYIQPGGNK